MDIASKIKEFKTEIAMLDDKKVSIEKRLIELKALIEEKKKKSAFLLDLEKQEKELLALLG
jgi:phage-related protein